MALSEELLSILACPRCKGALELSGTGDGLICAACRLKYPVRGDIPIMLVDEAEKVED